MTNSTDNSIDLPVELLLNAVFSLRASFSVEEGQEDVGTQLSVRMLLPHIRPRADPRLAAMLADTLEHHTPKSDAEADALLLLCSDFVERKSVQALDGCISVVLSRYQHYEKEQRPAGAINWLLKGIELEALLYCDQSKEGTSAWQEQLSSSGVCYRLLNTICLHTAQSLLKCLLREEDSIALTHVRGEEIVIELEKSNLMSYVPAVRLLDHIVAITTSSAEHPDEALIADHIISCLADERNDEDDGVVSSLARSSMHWDLLRLAHQILERRADMDFTAPFDVRGMQVLMERFTTVLACREVERVKTELASQEDIQAMRLSFSNGLMKAFVAENAQKKLSSSANRSTDTTSVADICAADLGKYSRDKQEKVVERMLDF